MRRAAAVCVECGGDKGGRHHMTQRCTPCREAFYTALNSANKEVHRAIRRGLLPKAKTLCCADCPKPASDWDHRDYRRPLEVTAVCRVCNFKRGPALWRPEPAKA